MKRIFAAILVCVLLAPIFLVTPASAAETDNYVGSVEQKGDPNKVPRTGHVDLPELNNRTLTNQGKDYDQNDGLEVILVMGLDKFKAEEVCGKYLNQQQSDLLLLVAIDHKEGSYSVLHLNRDTMADMYVLGDRGARVNTVFGQMALSHTYGTGGRDSCRNTVEAVSNFLHGVHIDHYLAMNKDVVAILNDYIGGVEVEILNDFSKVDPDLVKGQTQTLMGDQALTYVSVRKDLEDSSNMQRMERQRQYLSAYREQLRKASDGKPEFFAKALVKVADYITSNLTGHQLARLSQRLNGYSFGGFYTIDGELIQKEYMEFHAYEESVWETVLDLFFTPAEG